MTFLVYLLTSLAPGDPISSYLTPDITPEAIAELRRYLGLDSPMMIRYFKWLSRMLVGDLGNSYIQKAPVIGLIAKSLPFTLRLGLTSLLVALAVALPLGAISAYKPNSIWDHISSVLAYIGTAIPGFFIGLVLVYTFAVKLHLLPTGGLTSKSGGGGFGDIVLHMILPIAVTSFGILGVFIKQIRGSMLEVTNEEYIKMARAKGMSEFKVITGFVLRNALIPIVTSVGLAIPNLLSGAVVAEQLFSLPGIGKLLMQAVNGRDYPIILGVTMYICVIVLVINLALDVIYGFLDPRIRIGRVKN